MDCLYHDLETIRSGRHHEKLDSIGCGQRPEDEKTERSDLIADISENQHAIGL
jgi:hypothetical protein